MTRVERRLREILALLPEEHAEQLLDYAEFLVERHGRAPAADTPCDIARPEKESVIKAVKRLAATYPMLDRAKMLNETSVLVSQHVVGGRAAVEVIDELEVLFRRHYKRLSAEK